MSQTSKIVIGIAALVVVALGGYYAWYAMHPATVPTEQNTANSNGPSTLPTGSSTSDAAIEQDLSAIDAQLNAVKSDNTDTNASVNAAVTQ